MLKNLKKNTNISLIRPSKNNTQIKINRKKVRQKNTKKELRKNLKRTSKKIQPQKGFLKKNILRN